MSKATAELIQTLNGQLKELPALAKQMVQQYTTANFTIGGILIFIAIALVVVMFVIARAACDEKYEIDPEDIPGVMITLIISHFIFVIFSLIFFYHALNPILSIVKGLGGY